MIDATSGIYSDAALAAREAEILGAPPRITGLPVEDMDEEQRAIITRLHASISADNSRLSEYFLILAKRPSLFVGQLEYGTALFTGVIAPRERELVILRCGRLARAPYEWGEHVHIGKAFGLSVAEIERVIAGPDAEGWSAHEAALLRAVDELFADQMISDPTWAALASQWGDEQLVELPLLVGQYLAVAMLQNSVRLRLENGNIGLNRR